MKEPENQSWGRKFVESIKALIAKIKKVFTDQDARNAASIEATGKNLSEVEQAVKIWEKALEATQKAVKTSDRRISPKQAQKNTAENGGGKMSLDLDENGIQTIQSIGEKSVNEFSSAEIKATEVFARKYWQEMGTKSPFFRAWFGDWRAYDQAPVQIANQQGDNRDIQKNTDTGWDISVSGKVFNETKVHTDSPNKAARKYLPYINDIVRKAVLLDSYSIGDKKSINSLMMHSLYAVADIGNGPEVLKLYVEEMNDPNSSNTSKRAYQLQNVEKYRSLQRVHGNTTSSISAGNGIATVADLHAAVKSRDANFAPKSVNPVLLNEDGTPKVFYHGTDQRFTIFKPEEMSDREGSFFFAENREDAEAYGGNVYEVYLRGENLADYDNQPSEFYKLRNKRLQVQWLKARGYDGWYADMDSGGWGELSVFENTQVKSATDNIGTFDRSNPDIRYSMEGTENIEEQVLRERLQKATEAYGDIPKGEKPARDVTVPRAVSKGRNVSYTIRTALEAGVTPESMVTFLL